MTDPMQKHEKHRFGRKLRWFVCFLVDLTALFIYVMQRIFARIVGSQPLAMAVAQYIRPRV